MKTLKYLSFLLLIVFIGSSIYIAVQPNEFEFSRSRDIEAPTSLLYNKVNDFKNWPQFSPWIEKEPNATLTFGETTFGVDGNYSWNGAILGEGSIKTKKLEQYKLIEQHIVFIKPFESESNIKWTFKPSKTGTKVTWAMKGKQDFMTKLYTTFAGSIEKNTAPDFDRGLFKLDSIVSADMAINSIKIDGITEYGGGFYMYKTTSANGTNISNIMAKQYEEIMKYMIQNNIPSNGTPFTIYNEINTENGNIIMSNAIPVMNKVNIENGSEILCGFIPNNKVLKTTLKGNYTNLPKAWGAANTYISKNNLTPSEIKPFEIYRTDPDKTPNPADYITEIYIPIK